MARDSMLTDQPNETKPIRVIEPRQLHNNPGLELNEKKDEKIAW